MILCAPLNMLELRLQASPIGSATSTDINASKTSIPAAASLTPNMASMKVEHGVEVRDYGSICTQRLTYTFNSHSKVWRLTMKTRTRTYWSLPPLPPPLLQPLPPPGLTLTPRIPRYVAIGVQMDDISS